MLNNITYQPAAASSFMVFLVSLVYNAFFFKSPPYRNIYMKVPGNSLELPDQLSLFVVSPPKGGEMEVYMKVAGDSPGHPVFSCFVVPPQGEGREFICYEFAPNTKNRAAGD
ncbi:MAG: hypothetical protein D3910_12545 [Candidatus Electrothrix sp. ATG2]|nr:hypothetical protein [Candidatus Electrothrix sp. ATG2]